MSRNYRLKTIFALAFWGLSLSMQGCVATAVAGAAVGVTGAAVSATTKVAGTAVGLGVNAAGAAGKAVAVGRR